jgi:histidinol-phosphate/aromatic aminotransferase/cobyric acid decarboxylase-like protein
MSRGLVVRDVSSISGLRGCLRIGMGTPEQNDILLKVLGEL